MEGNTHKNALFELYLEGQLKGQERIDFEELLSRDIHLRHKLELHREIDRAIRKKDNMKLLQKLNHIHAREQRNKILHLYKRAGQIGVAASLAAMIGFGGNYILTDRQSADVNDLYTQYFVPDESIVRLRSNTLDTEHSLINAMMLYDQKNYTAAIELFMQDPGNMMNQLYTGLSRMQLDEFQKAIGHFDLIIHDGDNLFIDQAKWYASLSYLKLNEKDAARKLLDELSTSHGKFAIKAQNILTEWGDN